MQLRSYAQKYTRVQMIHTCKIYIPSVTQRMWTGLKILTVQIMFIRKIYVISTVALRFVNTGSKYKVASKPSVFKTD